MWRSAVQVCLGLHIAEGNVHQVSNRLGLHLTREGGLAQLARAPALQAGGQRFESVILHQVYGRPLKFNVSCFMFNVLEIFDILTHKTVSKTLFLRTE